LAGLCGEGFPGGLFAESIFGLDDRAASVDTDTEAVALACGLVISAGSDAVEAGADGVAVGTPFWLAASWATSADAGFAGAGANVGATYSKPKEAGCGGT
jgi:hypothetical protein